MEKILVTTDLSVNSKPGIRFAMQLAKQRKAELIILHVFYVFKETSWSIKRYEDYIQRTREKLYKGLSSLMKSIRRASNIPKVAFQMELVHGMDTVKAIMSYAKDQDCAYICISTRGAGVIKKLFGTHTSELIIRSSIPVITIPKKWRLKPLKKVLYAADLKQYAEELRKVVAFASPIRAGVNMLHLIRTEETLPDRKLVEESLQKGVRYKVNVEYKKIGIENTVLEEIDEVIEEQSPSVLVLFTHQNRSFIDRILFPGNAEEYCFYGKVPLLTFNKAG